MRFQEHINEDVVKLSLEEMNDLIQKNCKPYLKLIKGKDPMSRGMYTGGGSGEKDVRKDRKPKGMSGVEAKLLNTWLQKNGHNRRDQAVICISDPTRIALFGAEYRIFPKKNISYTYIDAHDANQYTTDSGWNPNMLMWLREPDELYAFRKPFDEYFHTDKGWDNMYRKKYECWIKCKSYYFIQVNQYWEWNAYKQEVVVL